MFRSQRIIIREYVCTSLNSLNYFRNIEFKILKIIPGVVAAIHVAGVRDDNVKAYAPARKLSTNLYNIYQCRVYSE